MRNIFEIFKQSPQPEEVSDLFHILNSSNILNSIYWWDFFKKIENVDGDIVECGVGRGRSLITLASLYKYELFKNKKYKRNIYALDSFNGFPEPSIHDKSFRNPKKGEWRASPKNEFEYSPSVLSKILNLAEVDIDIKFIEGFFEKTTKNFESSKIAILHLDGDLYDSIKSPLDNLWNKVSIGGIIVIDDFLISNSQKDFFPGARKAVMEFLGKNKSFEYLESLRGTPYLKRIK